MKKITHKNKLWELASRHQSGKIIASGKDRDGNPTTKLITTKWLEPKEFDREVKSVEKEYGCAKIVFAHEVTHLFRETIGKDGLSKDVEQCDFQRRWKNGRWLQINPADLVSDDASKKSDRTAWIIAILAVSVGMLGWHVITGML